MEGLTRSNIVPHLMTVGARGAVSGASATACKTGKVERAAHGKPENLSGFIISGIFGRAYSFFLNHKLIRTVKRRQGISG